MAKKKSKLSSLASKIKSAARAVGNLVNKATGGGSFSPVSKDQPRTTTTPGRTQLDLSNVGRQPQVSLTGQLIRTKTPGVTWAGGIQGPAIQDPSTRNPAKLPDWAETGIIGGGQSISLPTSGIRWENKRGGSGGGTDSDAINKLLESSPTANERAITTTSQISGVGGGGVSMPGTSQTASNPIDAYAGSQRNLSISQKQQEVMDKEQKLIDIEEEKKRENRKWYERMLDDQEGAVDEARRDAWDETGINPAEFFAQQEGLAKEIDVLNNKYAEVEAAKNQQVAQSMDKLASMNFINNQVQQIERNAAPQLNYISAQMNAKAALMEALRGNFGQAQTYVNQAVDAATADQRFKLQMYQEFRDINNDYFDGLSDIYKDSYDKAWQEAQDELDYAREEKKQVLEWYVTPEGQRAGITPEDTIESAADKFRRVGLTPSGSSGSSMGADLTVDIYAEGYLDGLYDLNDIPKEIRDRVVARADQLNTEALSATETPRAQQPRITAEQFGAGLRDTLGSLGQAGLSQVGVGIPGVGPSPETTAGFFSGLFAL